MNLCRSHEATGFGQAPEAAIQTIHTGFGAAAALRQFGAWLFNAGLVTPDPLSRLPLPKVTQEREPGVFTSEEIRLVVTSCQYGETLPTRANRAKWSMTGPERAVFYLVAVTTGLRAGELRQLRRCDFDLEASAVTIPAHVAKSRKQQRVPLRADVTEQLAEYLSLRHPGAPAFDLPSESSNLTRTLLDPDLKAAGIPREDEAGRTRTFHSLRHTFATNIDKAGRGAETTRLALRHSDLRVTQRYMHSDDESLRQAVESLPKFTPTEPPKRATGTVAADAGAHVCARNEALGCASERVSGHEANMNPALNAPERTRTRVPGFEPGTFGFVDRSQLITRSPKSMLLVS